MVVGIGSCKEEAFVTLDRGIVPRRRWFITQFVHSAVNRFRRPGDTETRVKDQVCISGREYRENTAIISKACTANLSRPFQQGFSDKSSVLLKETLQFENTVSRHTGNCI